MKKITFAQSLAYASIVLTIVSFFAENWLSWALLAIQFGVLSLFFKKES